MCVQVQFTCDIFVQFSHYFCGFQFRKCLVFVCVEKTANWCKILPVSINVSGFNTCFDDALLKHLPKIDIYANLSQNVNKSYETKGKKNCVCANMNDLLQSREKNTNWMVIECVNEWIYSNVLISTSSLVFIESSAFERNHGWIIF